VPGADLRAAEEPAWRVGRACDCTDDGSDAPSSRARDARKDGNPRESKVCA